jgi:hypothetical protein
LRSSCLDTSMGVTPPSVKAELSCPENTEVRRPLFTDLRVP